MSLDLPISIEPRVREFAKAQHITEGEAVVRLIQAGLEAQPATRAAGEIWGLGAEDADVLDEIVNGAMAQRRNRFERRLNA